MWGSTNTSHIALVHWPPPHHTPQAHLWSKSPKSDRHTLTSLWSHPSINGKCYAHSAISQLTWWVVPYSFDREVCVTSGQDHKPLWLPNHRHSINLTSQKSSVISPKTWELLNGPISIHGYHPIRYIYPTQFGNQDIKYQNNESDPYQTTNQDSYRRIKTHIESWSISNQDP